MEKIRLIRRDLFQQLLGNDGGSFNSVFIDPKKIKNNPCVRKNIYYALDDGRVFAYTRDGTLIYPDKYTTDFPNLIVNSQFSTDNYLITKLNDEKPYIINEYKRGPEFIRGNSSELEKNLQTGEYLIYDENWEKTYKIAIYLEKRDWWTQHFIYFPEKMDLSVTNQELNMIGEFYGTILFDKYGRKTNN